MAIEAQRLAQPGAGEDWRGKVQSGEEETGLLPRMEGPAMKIPA